MFVGRLVGSIVLLIIAKATHTKSPDFNWELQLIGDVIGARLNSFNDLVLIGQKCVIGAVSSSNGILKWRRVFEDDCEVVGYKFLRELISDQVVVQLSTGRLICFDVKNGLAIWETDVETNKSDPLAKLYYSNWLKGLYLVTVESILIIRSIDGFRAHTSKFSQVLQDPRLFVEDDNVFVLDFASRTAIKVDPITGSSVSTDSIPNGHCAFTADDSVVCVRNKGLSYLNSNGKWQFLENHWLKNGLICGSKCVRRLNGSQIHLDPGSIVAYDDSSNAIVDTNGNLHLGSSVYPLAKKVLSIHKLSNNLVLAKDHQTNLHLYTISTSASLEFSRYEDLSTIRKALIASNSRSVQVLTGSGTVYSVGAGGQVLWMVNGLGDGKLIRFNQTNIAHVSNRKIVLIDSRKGSISQTIVRELETAYFDKQTVVSVGQGDGRLIVYRQTHDTLVEAWKSNNVSVWKIRVPGERVLMIGAKHDTKVYSEQIYFSNGTIFKKYSDPHFFSVISKSDSATFISVIDARTGNVLYQGRHDDVQCADDSVKYVSADNWIAYTCKGQGKRFGGHLIAVSFFRESDFIVTRKSVKILPPFTNLVALTVSETREALTPRSVLFATRERSCFVLPWAAIDSYPDEYGRDMRMSFLIQDHRSSINKKIELARQVGIETAASDKLESVSLAFLYGLDIMMRSFTPSGVSYDALRDDFDRHFIAGIIGALFVACFVCKWLAQRSVVNNAWK